MSGRLDVIVLGEVLVELASPVPLAEAEEMRLSFSGDALNAAAAAAAAGASVGLVTAVGDDELGERIIRFAHDRGIDTTYVDRRPEPNGIYFASADPGGAREFVYVRRGSAASTIGPDDVLRAPLELAGALVAGGITQALSASCAEAVAAAVSTVAGAGGRVVFDPNFRDRLTTPAVAREALARVAPHAALVLPSCPGDTEPLLGTDDPATAAARCRALGAGAVAVTCGEDGVLADLGDGPVHLPPMHARSVVDTTGAGDVLAGTTAARLALGDPLLEALHLGIAAATLSLAGAGGTGRLATLVQSRELARRRPQCPLPAAAR
jgi:2-dehydro-3-deoxygluconokinase